MNQFAQSAYFTFPISRPWSEATFGGATSFEVQLPDQGLEEPPEMPAPQPWPEVPTPMLGCTALAFADVSKRSI